MGSDIGLPRGQREPHVFVPWRRARHRPELVEPGMILFGRMIRDARVALGMSQAGLGRACGIHQSMISRIENGKLPGLGFHRVVVLIYVLRDALGLRRLMG
jgi:hypothetical protein